MTRPRGFIDNWKPQAKTRLLLEETKTLLINSSFLPLSIRQTFYMGVSAYAWPKTEQYYGKLINMVGNARRAGEIDFADIRDDGIKREQPLLYASKGELIGAMHYSASKFRLNPMLTQDRNVIVWLEGAGLVPMVSQMTEHWGVEVISSGGFDSLTIKKQMADRFRDRETVVLHLGDYDPSGEAMYNALVEDIHAFGGDAEFIRLAVNPAQIKLWDLPTKPPKTKGNTHAVGWTGTETVELEAIPPAELESLINSAIGVQIDMDAFEEAARISDNIRHELAQLLEGVR